MDVVGVGWEGAHRGGSEAAEAKSLRWALRERSLTCRRAQERLGGCARANLLQVSGLNPRDLPLSLPVADG